MVQGVKCVSLQSALKTPGLDGQTFSVEFSGMFIFPWDSCPWAPQHGARAGSARGGGTVSRREGLTGPGVSCA